MVGPDRGAGQDPMGMAFALGERARGRTSPNPFVGCVIVTVAGDVVGQGWTAPAGGRHAEVMALSQAGPDARGGTAYVTLEPCNHTGRTPPCTDALLAAGIGRVVVAMSDPNPEAEGGLARMAAAGVDVQTDVAVDRARRTHEVFLHGLQKQRPFVIAKTASSIDGFIADTAGRSKWITGPAARERGHKLRAEVDAIVVGSGTALADDPALTVRLDGYDGPQPQRVILDRRGRVASAGLAMFAAAGPRPVVMDQATPTLVLASLWADDVRSVLLEGGPGVIGAFVAAGLIDRYEIHLAGLVLGGGLSAVAGTFTLEDAPRLDLVRGVITGDDLLVTAYPRSPDRR